MARDETSVWLTVSVVYSPGPGMVDEVPMQLPIGATVGDALAASKLCERYPERALDTLPVGIWGAFCQRGDRLRDHDRVEIYRPLQVDPKEARRQRQRAQRGKVSAVR